MSVDTQVSSKNPLHSCNSPLVGTRKLLCCTQMMSLVQKSLLLGAKLAGEPLGSRSGAQETCACPREARGRPCERSGTPVKALRTPAKAILARLGQNRHRGLRCRDISS